MAIYLIIYYVLIRILVVIFVTFPIHIFVNTFIRTAMFQKKQILLAYCSENAEAAFLIDRDLSEAGILLDHLTCDAGNPEVIRHQLLDQQKPVLLLISDNFLKSIRCMNGALASLLELVRLNRVLPVVIDGIQKNNKGNLVAIPTSFDRVTSVIQYMNHWQDLYLEMRRVKSSVKAQDEAIFEEKLKITRTISGEVGEYLRHLRGILHVSHHEFSYNSYQGFFEWTGLMERHAAFAATLSTRVHAPAPKALAFADADADTMPEYPTQQVLPTNNGKGTAYHNGNGNGVLVETPDADSFYEALAPIIQETPSASVSGVEAKIALPSINDFVQPHTSLATTSTKENVETEKPLTTLLEAPLTNKVAAKIDLPALPIPAPATNINELVDEISAETKQSATNQHYDILSNIFKDDEQEIEAATPSNANARDMDQLYDLLDAQNAPAEKEIAPAPALDTYMYIPVLKEIVAEIPAPIQEVPATPKVDNTTQSLVPPVIRMDLQRRPPIVAATKPPIATIRLETLTHTPPQPEVSTASLIEQANHLAAIGKSDESLQIWQTVVNNNPLDTTYRYTYAWLLARKAHLIRESTQQLEILLENNPKHVDANYLLAEIAEEHRDFAMARNYYERVANLNPFFPNIYMILGELIYRNFPEQKEEAAKCFEKVCEKDALNTHARLRFATLQKEMGNNAAAIQYLEKVVAIDANNYCAMMQLAHILHDLRQVESANAYYMAAASINPTLKTVANEDKFGLAPLIPVMQTIQESNAHLSKGDTLAVISDESSISSFRILRVIDPATGLEENDYAYITETTLPDTAAISQENLRIDAVHSAQLSEIMDEEAGNEADSDVTTDSLGDLNIELPIETQPQNLHHTPVATIKTAFVTGATSGIGRATAALFAKNGYHVIITGRREDRLQTLQQALQNEYKTSVHTLNFDVRDLASVKNAIEHLPDAWKNIDILVNNAGLAKGFDPIHEGDIEDWDLMIDTNIKGLLYMTRILAPQMVARRSGHIINIGSTAGKEVYPNGNVYCATKSAVEALTRAIRQDLYKYGVRVSAVHPAATEETEFSLVRFDGNSDRAAKVYENFQALKPSDVAEVVYFIASQPPHVNIQEIVVFPTQQAGFGLIDRSGR